MKIETKTKPLYPTETAKYISGYDYIAVCGAKTNPFAIPPKSIGTKYIFINQALRQLKKYPEPIENDFSINRVLVVFTYGYTDNDLDIIEEYAKKLKTRRVVRVENVTDFIDFLNKRAAPHERKVKRLDMFCHGTPGIISFHYGAGVLGPDERKGELKEEQIIKIKESVFDYDAIVSSFACRTGISVKGESFKNDDEAKPSESLAQKMADHWFVKVRAFYRRSLYGRVYGTKAEIKEAEKRGKIFEKCNAESKGEQKQVCIGEIIQNVDIDQREIYERDAERIEGIIAREDNKKKGGPIMPNGSWHDVASGDTPKGLAKGLHFFYPKEWQCHD